jgi:HK97 family phage portal protein
MLDRLQRALGMKAKQDRLDYVRSTIKPEATYGTGRQREEQAAMLRLLSGYVYAAVMMNARSIAAQPLRLYASVESRGHKGWAHKPASKSVQRYLKGDGRMRPAKSAMLSANTGGDVVEIYDHPILDLLNRVSPFMDGYNFSVLRKTFLQVSGNEYLHPIMGPMGYPVEIWVMPSQHVKILPTRDERMIEGYEYGVPPSQTKFAPDEVLHNLIPSPTDPLYGKGWVSSAAPAAGLLQAMDGYEKHLFENQARPDWGIFIKEHLTETQWNRMISYLDANLRGNRNAGRPYIFEGGSDARPLQFSPRDLSFGEGEERKVEVIAAVSGVPVTLLKANDPNLASAQVGFASYMRDTIHPYLVADAEFLNQQLLPLFGSMADGLFLAYDNPVQEDEERISRVLLSEVAGGVRSINEARSELGLDPAEDGDELRVNGVPLDAIGQPAIPAFGALDADAEDIQTRAVAKEVETTTTEQPLPSKSIAQKKYEDIDFTPPADVQEEAQRGLDWRKEHGRGGTVVGVARARDLSNGVAVSPETIGRMVNYFSRHTVDKEAEGFERGEEGYPSAGRIAWALWGGDAGERWANSIYDRMLAEDGEETKVSRREEETVEQCVARGIPQLVSEGYSYDQAVAIAYSQCGAGRKRVPVISLTGMEPEMKAKAYQPSDGEVWPERSYEARKAVEDVADYEPEPASDDVREGEDANPARRIQRNLVKVFNDQKKQIQRALTGEKAFGPADLLNLLSSLGMVEADYREAVLGPMAEATASGGQFGLAEVGVDTAFDVFNPRVASFAESYAQQFASEATRASLLRVRTVIARGLEQGESPFTIADEIAKDYAFSPERATVVARTESARAFVEGERLGWQESNVVQGKQWLLAAGACPFCDATAQRGTAKVYNLDEPFWKMGDTITTAGGSFSVRYGDVQGAPLHPNCRCDIIPVLIED